jgi:hypothetical protein
MQFGGGRVVVVVVETVYLKQVCNVVLIFWSWKKKMRHLLDTFHKKWRTEKKTIRL